MACTGDEVVTTTVHCVLSRPGYLHTDCVYYFHIDCVWTEHYCVCYLHIDCVCVCYLHTDCVWTEHYCVCYLHIDCVWTDYYYYYYYLTHLKKHALSQPGGESQAQWGHAMNYRPLVIISVLQSFDVVQ